MVWTGTTRARHERHFGRYASDLTDAEWNLIAPFLPTTKRTGRPRSTPMRDVLDAILYIASTGCAWRMVERTFARLNRCRRLAKDWLAKDWEKSIESSKAWILISHIRTLTRRIARHCNHV